jgi:hypothetical protein
MPASASAPVTPSIAIEYESWSGNRGACGVLWTPTIATSR